jgi:hypothetical protein
MENGEHQYIAPAQQRASALLTGLDGRSYVFLQTFCT